jgi:hypothetical protein
MASLDSILNSSAIVYIMLIGFFIHVYLKRTGKTFAEMCTEIKEFFQNVKEE